MLISIITVTYNAEDDIKKTLNSLITQKCVDYEYIIVDGCSKDNTLKYIENSKIFFEDKGIDLRVISEKDNGIYDAMNKGIRMAHGNYLFF